MPVAQAARVTRRTSSPGAKRKPSGRPFDSCGKKAPMVMIGDHQLPHLILVGNALISKSCQL